jgi:hypothetical protein
MSKTNKPKSSLANVIKERAQRPDFLPKSFIEDSTRLAEETTARAHEPFDTRSPAPTHPDARVQKNKAFEPIQSHEYTHPSTQAPTHPHSYAPTQPNAGHQKTKAFEPVQSHEYTHPSAQAPTHPRSYAHVVLSTAGPQEEFMLSTRQVPKQTNESLSPYRRKLTRTATYLAPQAKDQLRALSFNERTSEEDLLREALDMLFEQRGLPAIAFLGAPSRQQRPY